MYIRLSISFIELSHIVDYSKKSRILDCHNFILKNIVCFNITETNNFAATTTVLHACFSHFFYTI